MLSDTGIEGGNHAALVGMIQGIFIRYAFENQNIQFTVEPLVVHYKDGTFDYTNEIRITLPSGTYIVAVYPENVKEP